uniref:Thionin-like cystein-rich peptide n=1 Tax=Torenia fournieri TaxID=68875 RepID=B9ZZY7_9LAMI|nr:thionin-like cystein-rich peptide [Torenia fournieri]
MMMMITIRTTFLIILVLTITISVGPLHCLASRTEEAKQTAKMTTTELQRVTKSISNFGSRKLLQYFCQFDCNKDEDCLRDGCFGACFQNACSF